MTTQINPTPVVRVGSLAAFRVEVPPPALVRLSLTEQWRDVHAGKMIIPNKHIMLSLQGVNANGEIAWLTHGLDVHWGQNEPAFPRDRDAYQGMDKERDIVRSHLESLGYEVREGDYALPKSLLPLNGRFECVQWRRDGERIVVEPAEYQTTLAAA
ncbi:MAG: hypothetical protein HY260_20080 [Chloroflexi bacterium]|nr:hypothetical protein [Chloroflexota bacterium]